ncbi:hypothetical protein BK660_21835 [Pseudomonas brassicacearum]|uniref:Uncharacterized protein n=1 Tax=Pseudomonas brassicacearum TaxID=930166 RepID=A0A423HXM4_9PSED|nr:hypothetical protein [Pseudomonas brassicacearum]RON17933.1 hypothetical protein BK660_21835 [Pseudomonas brassicacearum]
MNIKCLLKGHDVVKVMVINDMGAKIMAGELKGWALRYIPADWCARCGKVSGSGFFEKKDSE